MKTLDDATREDVAELVSAAVELLKSSMFQAWIRADENDPDSSDRDCQDRMAKVLAQIGLPQMSREEFKANIEHTLRTKPHLAKSMDNLRHVFKK